MKYSYWIWMWAVLFVQCKPKEVVKVTQENKREVLTQYGRDNPEREVLIKTKMGNIRLKLYEDTPLHAANFIKVIKDGYYDDPIFYRIVEKFVVQGGVPGKRLPYLVPAEFNPHHFHKRGALAMARLEENNPEKESSATEFYIVQGSRYEGWDYDEEEKVNKLSPSTERRKVYMEQGGELTLDERYTVFGEVVEGMDVVDRIAAVRVNGETPEQKVSFEIEVIENK